MVQLGTETRKHLCIARAEIQIIRSALPSTALPHCTPRQLQALSLTMDYMFTDMHSEDRLVCIKNLIKKTVRSFKFNS